MSKYNLPRLYWKSWHICSSSCNIKLFWHSLYTLHNLTTSPSGTVNAMFCQENNVKLPSAQLLCMCCALMGEWAFDVCAVYLHMYTRYTSVCKGPFTNDVSTLLRAKGGGSKISKMCWQEGVWSKISKNVLTSFVKAA